MFALRGARTSPDSAGLCACAPFQLEPGLQPRAAVDSAFIISCEAIYSWSLKLIPSIHVKEKKN